MLEIHRECAVAISGLAAGFLFFTELLWEAVMKRQSRNEPPRQAKAIVASSITILLLALVGWLWVNAPIP